MQDQEIKTASAEDLQRELNFVYYEMARMGRDPQALIRSARAISADLTERQIKGKVSEYQYNKSLQA